MRTVEHLQNRFALSDLPADKVSRVQVGYEPGLTYPSHGHLKRAGNPSEMLYPFRMSVIHVAYGTGIGGEILLQPTCKVWQQIWSHLGPECLQRAWHSLRDEQQISVISARMPEDAWCVITPF